jgi:hypothetical protein
VGDEVVFELDARGGVLIARQRRPIEDLADARRAQQQLDDALEGTGARRAVFDRRGQGDHDPEVREAMWSWLSQGGRLDAVALVLDSELARVRANMTAISRHVKLKAFIDPEEAEQWVRTTVPGRSTGFFPRME